MRLRSVVCAGMVLCLAVGWAGASSIGVYFSADGSDCDATVAQNSPITVYILADLYGDAAVNGITGAEFQVRNWPGSWFVSPTPNPAANISVGNPIAGGCNIAFPSCQAAGPNGIVLLYTMNAFATTAPTNLTLVVDRHQTPSSPNWPCPLVRLCDPIFSKLCISAGQAFLNGPPCNVGISSQGWSGVKRLFD